MSGKRNKHALDEQAFERPVSLCILDLLVPALAWLVDPELDAGSRFTWRL